MNDATGSRCLSLVRPYARSSSSHLLGRAAPESTWGLCEAHVCLSWLLARVFFSSPSLCIMPRRCQFIQPLVLAGCQTGQRLLTCHEKDARLTTHWEQPRLSSSGTSQSHHRPVGSGRDLILAESRQHELSARGMEPRRAVAKTMILKASISPFFSPVELHARRSCGEMHACRATH